VTGIQASDLPATTRALGDLLLDRLLGPDVREGRLELERRNGVFLWVWRHERLLANQLERYDHGDPSALAAELIARIERYRS
jgi:hypothetical protein